MTYSTIVRGGTLFDGVSPLPTLSDLRLEAGEVVEVGHNLAVDGARVVDAHGQWVLPGFVDAHSHTDAGSLTGEQMELRALAGVTTDIVGQDGLGLLPDDTTSGGHMIETLAPLLGLQRVGQFSSVGDYLEAVDAGAYSRVATLVPHGAVRSAVMGPSRAVATDSEAQRMSARVRRGLAEGAVGVSTGLSYAPASAASTEELIAVLDGLPAGTPYVTHLRDYGVGFEESLAEAIRICAETNLSLHLSHFHVSGPGRRGTAATFERMVTAAPVGTTWDTYPYTSGCTFARSILPAETQALSTAALLAILRAEPLVAARIRDELDLVGPGPTVAGGWEVIYLAGEGPAAGRNELLSVAERAASAATTPGSIILAAIESTEGHACIVVDHGHVENVHRLAVSDRHLVGSDGILGSGVPHPRAANSFFRFLSWAQDGIIPVETGTMISRMTGSVASRFGLDVGVLRVGAPADILIVDPTQITAGPERGQHVPRAVQQSFIDGEPIIRNGSWLGKPLQNLALRKES
ncbi:amidohydrolase family protein [Lysinibacter cavernae]|uniref:N-acyl-D-amino-acid deacylase n=1 Tax=Lysinibacter cavernae TaxID=1640652 RepID=A0A7X5R3B4_9MICO|nr:N-acyl-D-amino-acid deacylase [Lysinibacter cavernae]